MEPGRWRNSGGRKTKQALQIRCPVRNTSRARARAWENGNLSCYYFSRRLPLPLPLPPPTSNLRRCLDDGDTKNCRRKTTQNYTGH